MRTLFRLIFICGLYVLCSTHSYSHPLFFADGSLTYGAKQLCKVLQIEDKIRDAKDFNAFFQENFLRPKGFDRLEEYVPKIAISSGIYNDIIDVCDLLEMTGTIYPIRDNYDYIVLFGSSTELMRMVCRYVKSEMSHIIANNADIKIYFLVGERPLNAKVDSPAIMEALKNQGQELTETSAAKLIWEEEFGGKNIECEFVDVRMEEVKRDDDIKRPSTLDTVNKLLATHNFAPGHILAVSINPFIQLQDNVFRNVLESHKWFVGSSSLETVGYSLDGASLAIEKPISSMHKMNILLDTIARCAYEEIKQIKK